MSLHFKLQEDDDKDNALLQYCHYCCIAGTAEGTGLWLHKQRCSLSQRFGLVIVYLTIIVFIIVEQT